MNNNFTELLSKEEKIRLGFYTEFEGNAQQAYDFIMQPKTTVPDASPSGQEVTVPLDSSEVSKLSDGIYLIDCHGGVTPFVGDETETIHDTAYIGVVGGGHALKVALNEFRSPLQESDFDRDTIRDYGRYLPYEIDALCDWDGEQNTEHILLQNPALKERLKDGEFIPSLAQLAFLIWHNRNAINEALEFVGGTPLSDSYCWCSTEGSATGAWYVNGSGGYVLSGSKYNSFVVRAVCAF